MMALMAASLAGPVLADEMAAETIVVTASPRGYSGIDTKSATKTDTRLIDVPQSVSVLTRDRLDDQGLLSIGDALRYVPGITVGQGEGHRDQTTIRGTNSTADFYVDGLRDDVQYYRDFYNVDRLEILKGPNALIFGRGGGGGVINRASKSPVEGMFVATDAAIDSEGGVRIGADVNGELGEGAGVRLNAFWEDGAGFRDAYDLERWAINPTVAVALTERLSLGAGFEHVDDDRVVDRGVPSVNGRPLAGFDRAFFGVPGLNHSAFNADVATVKAALKLGASASVTSTLRYGDYDKSYTNVFPATPVSATNMLGVEAYSDPTRRKSLISQTDLAWKGKTGSIGHVVLAGAEVASQNTDNQRINGFFSATANTTRVTVPLANPLVVPPVFFRVGPGNRQVRTEADTLGLYIQDQISIGDHVEIVAGLRYDRFELTFDNVLTATRFARTDGNWSPRLGLVLKPQPGLSLYGSFSRSFLPQSGDQFLSLDLTTAALEPERFENFEIGAKWEPSSHLSATVALYRLDRTNTRAAGAVAGTTVLTGEARSKGLEVELVGKVTPNWQIAAGYSLSDAEIRRTTTAAPAGRKLAQVPRHKATVWNRYAVSEAVGLGLGIVHQSKSFASISNAVTLPAHTRFDAAIFVTLPAGIEAQVNVENLFNADYFPTAHNDNNISPGAPTTARLTLRKRF